MQTRCINPTEYGVHMDASISVQIQKNWRSIEPIRDWRNPMGSLTVPLTLLALSAVLMIVVIFIQVAALKDYEELEKLRQLVALQRTRIDEATRLWQERNYDDQR